jgi:2-aminoadipate transaminase
MAADVGGPAAGLDWSRAFAARTRRRSAEVAAILAATPPGVLSLAGGFPHPATFPADVVDELVARILRDDPSALQYTPSEGVPGLRAYLAERQETLQGRAPEPAELLVTSGGMEAIALACQAMVDPGDVIAVEAPTYLGALMAFAGFEASIEEIPMDRDGLQVDALAERLAGGLRPKLLYVIPEYQNPTGRTLPIARRRELVELCRRHGVLIVEDVAYREIAFDDGPPPSLWSLAPDLVVQAGTFSKIFAPGVRLGWAIGPRDVLAQMAVAKQTTDQCSNGFGQRIVEAYGRSGGFERQLPRSRELYAGQWRALEAALQRHLPDGCSWTTPGGGFFAWLTLPGSLDAGAIRADAVAAGVTYVPGAAFHVGDGGTNALRLSYSYLSDDDLDRAVERLAGVIRSHL